MPKERPFFRDTMRRDVERLGDESIATVVSQLVLGADASCEEVQAGRRVARALLEGNVTLPEDSGRTELLRDLDIIWSEEVIHSVTDRIANKDL